MDRKTVKRLKVREFRELVHRNLQKTLGFKKRELSRHDAWLLYKAAIVTSFQFLLTMVDEDALLLSERPGEVRLPLNGIGAWKIYFRDPRVLNGKPSKLHGVINWVPYFRFKPSRNFRDMMLKLFYGIDVKNLDVNAVKKDQREKKKDLQRRLKTDY